MTREVTRKSGAVLLCMASEMPLGIPKVAQNPAPSSNRILELDSCGLSCMLSAYSAEIAERGYWKAFLVRFSVFLISFNYAL